MANIINIQPDLYEVITICAGTLIIKHKYDNTVLHVTADEKTFKIFGIQRETKETNNDNYYEEENRAETIESDHSIEINETESKESDYNRQIIERELTDNTVGRGKMVWIENATRLLIALYQEHEKDFRNTKMRNDDVWKLISQKLKDNGYMYQWKQIENKWKHLRKLYIKQKENMGPNSTGAKSFSFQYFEEMDTIFNKKHSIQPVTLASSSKGSQLPSNIVNSSFGAKKRKLVDEDDRGGDNPESKSKKTLISWLEESREMRNKQEERRHKELLEVQRESSTALIDILKKLLDKV